MPGLYDNYQLSNSRAIPEYVGNTIPELQQVSSTLQGRYDQGIQQSDLLDQAIKTSTAAPVDQPLLTQLKTNYRGKLQQYAEQGDYERMWRNVAMDARDFMGSYKTIDANRQAMGAFQQDLHKRVEEGKLDPAVAAAKQAQISDTYSGLKVDPQTGTLTNPFQAPNVVPSIDVPEKVNKWLSESHAIEMGWKAERDVNGWYVTNGTERKTLPWEKIKPVIDAGISLDPEVKAYLSQEKELAPYYNGLSTKMSTGQVQSILQKSPQLNAAVQDKITHEHMDPVSALHEVVGEMHQTSKVNAIYDYARKGVQNSTKTEYAEKMDPITEEMEKKKLALKDKQLFSVPYADSTGGYDIKSVKDFEGVRGQAQGDYQKLMHQFAAFKNAPNHVSYDSGPNAGKVFEKGPDGQLTDVTADANKLRDQIQGAKSKVDQFDAVKQASADAVGFHPQQGSPAAKKEADYQADLYRTERMKALSQQTDARGNYIPGSFRQPTAEELADLSQKTEAIRSKTLEEQHPAFGDYQKELAKRLQPQGVSNNMLVFNDDNMKKTLGDFATGAISKMGLKSGLVSLKVRTGKDAGTDLSADDYDDLQGKIVPLGITNDSKTGETQIVMRAMQDIHGKKVKGENMIMSMKDVGGVDDYVRTHASPEEYQSFTMDRALKTGLNNVAGTMNYPIHDKDGAVQGNVQITRRKTDSEGPGSFSIRIPTSTGYKSISADTYDGVIDILNRIQAQHK